MEYVVKITGLTGELTLQQISDIVEDVTMYLDTEHITYNDVYIESVDNG